MAYNTEYKNDGFTYAYGWNVYYKKILGICSAEGEHFLVRHRAWGWILIICISTWIPQLCSVPLLWGELNLLINCLSTNVTFIMSMMKISVLRFKRRVIDLIHVGIIEDWMNVETKEELVVMMETARISNFSAKLSFSLTTITVATVVICQIWIALGYDKNPDLDPRLDYGFLFEAYFPFNTTRVIVFVPIWLSQALSTYLTGVAYAGPESFVSMVVLHLCGQLRIVRNSLKALVNDTIIHGTTKYWQRLGAIVTKHEQINERAEVLNQVFSSLLLAQMLIYSLTFCFQGFAMFTNLTMGNSAAFPMPILLADGLYGVYTIVNLYISCYVGDKLFVESTNISDDFYATSWYELKPKEAMSFIHICHRASRPLELRAGKFCIFNMQLFIAIMKNSMGYLSLLMALKDRL